MLYKIFTFTAPPPNTTALSVVWNGTTYSGTKNTDGSWTVPIANSTMVPAFSQLRLFWHTTQGDIMENGGIWGDNNPYQATPAPPEVAISNNIATIVWAQGTVSMSWNGTEPPLAENNRIAVRNTTPFDLPLIVNGASFVVPALPQTQFSFNGTFNFDADLENALQVALDADGNPIYKQTPALDADGNPIPMLDADGNPMLDTDGNPIYKQTPVLDADGKPIPVLSFPSNIELDMRNHKLHWQPTFVFNGDTKLYNAIVENTTPMPQITKAENCTFRHCTFEANQLLSAMDCDFENCTFLGTVNFTNCIFRDCTITPTSINGISIADLAWYESAIAIFCSREER